jgi:hypothetical protein
VDAESNFAAAFDAVSSLGWSSSQAFLASLDATSSSASTGVPLFDPQAQVTSAASLGTENDTADVLNALDVFSKLEPAQRRRLISSLTNLVAQDSSESAADRDIDGNVP